MARPRRSLVCRSFASALVFGLLVTLIGCAAPAAPLKQSANEESGDDEPRVLGMPSDPPARPEPTRAEVGAVSLIWENDFFAGKDQNYTNGLTLGYLTPPIGSLSRGNWLRRYAELFHFLPEFGEEDREERIAFALVHTMFTPEDIEDPDPPLGEQPYAGVASLDQSFISRGDGEQHSYLLRLGWVGPRTSADDLQITVHEWIDSDEPLGWSTQLPNEGIVNFGYEYRRQVGKVTSGSFSADAVVAIGGHFGTYFTGGNAGLTGRLGWNLPDPIGGTSPQRGLQSEGFRAGDRGHGWRFGLHAGVEGFAIAHYLPLDGTVFRDSRSVDDRAPWVGSARAGFDLGIGRFGLGFSYQVFTETFREEREQNEFGTIVFSWSF